MKGEIRTVTDASPIGVTAETVFTPVDANGNTTVTFSLTAKDVAPYLGEQLVIFEYLYGEDGQLVAQDASVDNIDQRFFVEGGGGDEPGPEKPDNPDNPGSKQPEKPGHLPKTGGQGIAWMALLGIAAIGTGTALTFPRLRATHR